MTILASGFHRPLRRLPSTLIGLEVEPRINFFLVNHPQVRRRLYRSSAVPGVQATGSVLLPSIHYRAGMGHRVSSWISAFLLSRKYGVPLVRLPWRDDWDTFLGLDEEPLWTPEHGRVCLLPPVGRQGDLPGEQLFDDLMARNLGRPVTLRLPLDPFSFDQSGAFGELARRYWQRHTRPERGRAVRVSVHVRRGDVTSANGERFRGLEYFERQARAVVGVLDDLSMPWKGLIHSQGSGSELEPLLDAGFQLGGASSEFEDFHEMACSDVLIASPSSFSMTAGMISGGAVLRPRQWYHALPADDRWVGTENDGSLDDEDLRKAVHTVCARIG
ncbi:hypothetical protein KIH74_11090 [Kineosporia sp. J2-2]|uniref:Uncharacterized protein n=1 Tax=Kineosporia corallincola TaxID=2835133 RepID=A0ABS5THE1_9ACTN|nr:hypothetical protein [Kineosporia corallincola]MBT0769468.1 hypothetical protein [Kineosporia corallincola]